MNTEEKFEELKKLIDTFSIEGFQLWYGYLWMFFMGCRDLTWDIEFHEIPGKERLLMSESDLKVYWANWDKRQEIWDLRKEFARKISNYTLDVFNRKTGLAGKPDFITQTCGAMSFGYKGTKQPYFWNSVKRASYPEWLDGEKMK